MIYLKNEKSIKRNYQNLISLNTNSINNAPLKNFAQSYRSLGGRTIPDEIVNMIIRKTQLEMSKQNHYVTPRKALLQTSHIIRSISNIKGIELWRLSSAFCKYQYAFKISYLKWLWFRIVSNVI